MCFRFISFIIVLFLFVMRAVPELNWLRTAWQADILTVWPTAPFCRCSRIRTYVCCSLAKANPATPQRSRYTHPYFKVDLVGLKPTTPRMQIWCSIHLNYKPLKRRDRGSNSGGFLRCWYILRKCESTIPKRFTVPIVFKTTLAYHTSYTSLNNSAVLFPLYVTIAKQPRHVFNVVSTLQVLTVVCCGLTPN